MAAGIELQDLGFQPCRAPWYKVGPGDWIRHPLCNDCVFFVSAPSHIDGKFYMCHRCARSAAQSYPWRYWHETCDRPVHRLYGDVTKLARVESDGVLSI